MAVSLGRYLWHGAAVTQVAPDQVAVVALVSEHDGRVAVTHLRTALERRTIPSSRRPNGTPRLPRTSTKQEVVLALLRRPEGATIAQVCNDAHLYLLCTAMNLRRAKRLLA